MLLIFTDATVEEWEQQNTLELLEELDKYPLSIVVINLGYR